MIVVDPKKRITAGDILNHPWIKKFEGGCCGDLGPHEHADEAKKIVAALKSYKG